MPAARTNAWGLALHILMLAGCQRTPLPPSISDQDGGADTTLVPDARAVADSSTAETRSTGGTITVCTWCAPSTTTLDAAPAPPSAMQCLGTVGGQAEPGCLAPVRQWSTSIVNTGTCVVLETGGVRCWGYGCTGALGEGVALMWRLAPGPEVLTGARQVSRSRHACAVLETGGLRCWGANNAGQVGDGTTVDPRLSPSDSDVLTGVEAVGTGAHHTCALMKTGGVRCWGMNNAGQLGDGTYTDRHTPPATDVIADVRAISVELFTTCVLRKNGGVRCWGSNVEGQLGDGTTTNRKRPADTDVITGARAVATSGNYTCAVLETGGLRCWGKLNRGPSIGSPPDTDLLTGVSAVAPGTLHACAIVGNGDLRCWGANENGQLGTGERSGGSTTPVGAVTGVSGVSVGLNYTCAKLATGLHCWGSTGTGNLTERYQPTLVPGLCQ
jgi:alpha-tubulin suppressor-like RCC1 family protein